VPGIDRPKRAVKIAVIPDRPRPRRGSIPSGLITRAASRGIDGGATFNNLDQVGEVSLISPLSFWRSSDLHWNRKPNRF